MRDEDLLRTGEAIVVISFSQLKAMSSFVRDYYYWFIKAYSWLLLSSSVDRLAKGDSSLLATCTFDPVLVVRLFFIGTFLTEATEV